MYTTVIGIVVFLAVLGWYSRRTGYAYQQHTHDTGTQHVSYSRNGVINEMSSLSSSSSSSI